MNPEPPTSGSVAHPDDDATRNLCLWPFGDPHAAARLERELCTTGTDPVVLADGALLTWRPGRRVPHLREPQNIGRSRPLGLGFWGLLFGIVVAGPELAASAQQSTVGLDESLRPVGIDPELVSAVRLALVPGTSALAAWCDDPTADLITLAARSSRVVTVSGPPGGPVAVRWQLSDHHSSELRRIFAV